MISRRALFDKSARAFAAAALLPPRAPGANEDAFPPGSYTPYGYLDNPYHCWDVHRSGVLRSAPGVGFGFLYPAGPGGYFDFAKNNVYESYLRLGFGIGDSIYWDPPDFGADLISPHHSKNLFVYRFSRGNSVLTVEFVQVGEDALAARLKSSAGSAATRVFAANICRLGGSSWWGRDGLAGEYDAKDDCMLAHSFAAGPVFALMADRPSKGHYAGEDLGAWLKAPRDAVKATTYHPHPLVCALAFDVPAGESILIALARSENRSAALLQARRSRSRTPAVIATKREADRAFWSGAPRLEGDWPEHWKHGWVYDFETLRMMVRRPIGVYKHSWDAMQIQAPRNVLAETSIDMWALSYADAAAAKEVFVGQFLDALADNIPCMREDGVMNMVAADGSECGTSISWCYPFFCAASIFDRTRDTAWLRTLYPGLARLLRWTLRNRRDEAGFLIGKCSWETGMDASKRFLIEQPTGGELTEFVRLVELQ
ncbi:MAG TPA: hypothetical protein VHA11_04095, partial [Bryobacteraceae bacterium]|nr:hypothetical protein [Bryobacteraceae bacterium]